MTIPTTADQLLISELFGPTIQGEGPSLGQQAAFVRLGRCNLTCADCDSPFTWDTDRFDLAAETRRMPVAEVLAWVLARDTELVVVTGGEPLLQQRRLVQLVTGLRAAGRRIEVETNGTVPPVDALSDVVSRFNVSPKLGRFGRGIPLRRRIRPGVLRRFSGSGRAVFKFVVSEPAELTEVADLAKQHNLAPIWVMPEGTDAATTTTRLRALAEPAIAHGFHLTTRLHLLVWGDQRGH